MESSELTRKRALAATLYAARQNPGDADMVTRNNRLKAAAQAFIAPYSQPNYMNVPCCPPLRTGGAASDYGDSRLDEAVFAGTAINTFTNVMDRRAGAAICCGPPPATIPPQGVQLYGDCSCLTAPTPAGPSDLLPGAPIIAYVVPGDATLTVYFTAPTDDGGSPITSYRYLVDGVLSDTVLTNTDPFTITGLTNEQTYTIEIYAVNGIGPGPNSDPTTGTPSIYMIMTITTTDPNTVMSLPFDGLGAEGVTVDWGDGTITTYTITPIENTYASPGSYTILIKGSATTFGFGNLDSYIGANLITNVIQWGALGLTSLAGAFNSAINLIALPNVLPLNINNMDGMLINAIAFNQDISAWDVSKVTIMKNMFNNALAFNNGGQPLTWGKKTGLVTNMDGMFSNAIAFNQDISAWDVSEVTTMYNMFYNAFKFNQDLSSWNVHKVQNMSRMFASDFEDPRVMDFNSPLNWNAKTGAVNDMSSMFSNAQNFNQDISDWDVSEVINMSNMFDRAFAFNQNLSTWNVAKVQNMAGMFNNASNFNSPLDWGSKTASVKNMNSMFTLAIEFDQDISGWNLSSVQYTIDMFKFANKFNNGGQPLTWGATTASILAMNGMFYYAISFNQDISSWNVSEVTDMTNMFNSAVVFNQNLSSWNVVKVKYMINMFQAANTFNNGGQPLTWNNKTALVENMSGMFSISNFNQDISGWDVSKVQYMSFMFYNANFFNQDLSTWNANALTAADRIFCGCPMLGQTAKYPPKLLTLGQNYGC